MKLFGFLMLTAAAIASSQTTTVQQNQFTFGPGAGVGPCAAILTWDGVADAYPEDMGGVCLNSSSAGAGPLIDVPWQLGYLNNGYLAGCNAIAWSPKVFTVGDGTHNGDAFTQAGSTTCPYYTGEYGDGSDHLLAGFSVVASYTVVRHVSCGHGHCIYYFVDVLQGGTGTVQETQI